MAVYGLLSLTDILVTNAQRACSLLFAHGLTEGKYINVDPFIDLLQSLPAAIV